MAKFTVNGRAVTVENNQKLLRYLRDTLHLTSVKDGCSEGACGTCTVLIDGKPTKACIPQTDKLEGKSIVTVEGLTDFEKQVYTYAFGMAGAVQCGFCIPGMVMSAKGLLDMNPNPTREEAAYAIRNNICRCTGYKKIEDAVLLAAKMFREGTEAPHETFTGKIGENLHTVESTEDSIIVDGKEIKIYAKANAAELPWGEIGVDVVLECTGFYTSKAKAQAHIDAGAKKVVISAPAGNDLPTIVYNVNHEQLTKDDNIISAASCTTNCLAPMAKALNDLAPIKSGIMCTIHAYTGDQMTLDGPQRKGDLRRSRAAACNIVPNSTGAAKAIGLVIPELNGKLIGSAQRVPTPTGSTTILTAVVEGEVTVDQINAAMKAAANESYGYNTDEIVSSDIVGMSYGSLFDATQTMALPTGDGTTEVQVVSWYDNENSYTSQMVRTIKYFGKLLEA